MSGFSAPKAPKSLKRLHLNLYSPVLAHKKVAGGTQTQLVWDICHGYCLVGYGWLRALFGGLWVHCLVGYGWLRALFAGVWVATGTVWWGMGGHGHCLVGYVWLRALFGGVWVATGTVRWV